MEEKIDKKLFGNLISRLFINYRQKVDEKLISLFWDEFKGISGERFRLAIKDLLETEDHFPTVAIIKKYLTVPEAEQTWEWPTNEDFERTGNETQIGRDCLKIMKLKINDKLTHQEYYNEMMKLEEKYPKITQWVNGRQMDCSFRFHANLFLHGKRDHTLYSPVNKT